MNPARIRAAEPAPILQRLDMIALASKLYDVHALVRAIPSRAGELEAALRLPAGALRPMDRITRTVAGMLNQVADPLATLHGSEYVPQPAADKAPDGDAEQAWRDSADCLRPVVDCERLDLVALLAWVDVLGDLLTAAGGQSIQLEEDHGLQREELEPLRRLCRMAGGMLASLAQPLRCAAGARFYVNAQAAALQADRPRAGRAGAP